jgi:hypothetical protein
MSASYRRRMQHPRAAAASRNTRKHLVRGVGHSGSLNDLANLAHRVGKDGEEYGGALQRLLNFKKQSKKRSNKNQAKFAWFEEDKRMKKEASKLWKEIEKYHDKFLSRRISSSGDRNSSSIAQADTTTMANYKHNWMEVKMELNSEIASIKELVEEAMSNTSNSQDEQEQQLFEMATILSEYNTTQELIQNQIETEISTLTNEVQDIRSSIYKSLRSHDRSSSSAHVNGEANLDIFQLISNIKYANTMDPSAVFEISQRLNTTYEKFVNNIKNLKSNINTFFAKQQGSNEEKNELLNDENKNKQNAHNAEAKDVKTLKRTSSNNTTLLFNNWSHKAHNLFLKIYRETVARGKSKSMLYKRYQMSDTSFDKNTGGKTLEEIQIHVQKYEKYKFLKNEIKEKKVTWSRYLNEEVNHFKTLCVENYKQLEANKQKQELIRLQNLKTTNLQSEFKRLKAIYDEKQKKAEAERMEKQRVQDEYDEMLRKRAEELYKKNKELTQIYQQQKQLKQQEYQMQLKKAQEEREKARLEMLPHLTNRVNYRKKCFEEKNKARKEQLQLLIEEKERKEAILLELTKTCPYAEKISSENLHDPERLFQATKAFELAVAELDAMLANPLDGRLEKPLNGFNSKKIVRDVRFKLMEKLTRAGLQSAPYAQAMMINMSRQGKVHRISQNAPFRNVPIVNCSAAQIAPAHQTFL